MDYPRTGADIVLLGDSGGGLFVTALAIKFKHNLNAKAICLVNPAVALRNVQNNFYKLVVAMYLNKADPADSLVSPILANDFSKFPPTLVITCEKDELKTQGTELFNKLEKNNIKVKLADIPNEDHLGSLWAAGHPKAQPAINETVKFINELTGK